MGLRSRMGAAWRALSVKSDGDSVLSGPLALWAELFSRRNSKAGQPVTINTALQVSTVFACLRVIAEGVAQSPCDLFQDRAGGKGKDIATNHELYPIFGLQPNDIQTAFEFFETLVFHAGLTGDFIAFKSIVNGKIDELIPLEPGRRTIVLNPVDLTLQYSIRGRNGSMQPVPAELIWHVRGPSWNGHTGMTMLHIAREAIGLTMAIEADQAHLYKNGLRTSGTYSVEGNLTPAQYKDLRAFIKEHQAGDSGEPLILDRAAKYMRDAMTSVDAQTLESRKHQIEEVCRAFRVIPIMVGHGGDQSPTFASAEQFFIAHVVHTLLPWCRRIEMSINKNLIGRDAWRTGLKAKFNLNALLRGSFKDRQDSFAKMLGSGGSTPWAEVNEVRELDDMNPVDWGDGKPVSAMGKNDVPPAVNPDDPSVVNGNKRMDEFEARLSSNTEIVQAIRSMPAPPAPVVNVTVPIELSQSDDGIEVMTVTKHDPKGRILETEKRKIGAKTR